MALEFEEKKLLQETARLTKENHEMLVILRRGQKWGRIWKAVYWVLIIGVAIGSFYFLQPYVDLLEEMYSNAQRTLNNFGEVFQ